jgi:enoyl-CoA hydratase/carnithine racemase
MKALETAYETLDLGAPAPEVVVVTLNRPERYNAMTATMFDELERAAIALDDEELPKLSPARPARPAGARRPGAGDRR